MNLKTILYNLFNRLNVSNEDSNKSEVTERPHTDTLTTDQLIITGLLNKAESLSFYEIVYNYNNIKIKMGRSNQDENVYRLVFEVLLILKERGIVTYKDGRYSITQHGRIIFNNALLKLRGYNKANKENKNRETIYNNLYL
ncbi:MAG: hypothetical protein ARM1_0114 [Candidatus Micrarchaeota archaeon]|nr:MAG: hypothetical protein ARM1_0114 [Candidatus Micrarchaeota archaeon]